MVSSFCQIVLFVYVFLSHSAYYVLCDEKKRVIGMWNSITIKLELSLYVRKTFV